MKNTILRNATLLAASLLLVSCGLLEGDEGAVTVSLSPERTSLRDDVALTITVANSTAESVWYHGCGQSQEKYEGGAWMPLGAVHCYMQTGGVRVGPGKTYSESVRLYVQDAGTYRVQAMVVGKRERELSVEARTTNAVTVVP